MGVVRRLFGYCRRYGLRETVGHVYANILEVFRKGAYQRYSTRKAVRLDQAWDAKHGTDTASVSRGEKKSAAELGVVGGNFEAGNAYVCTFEDDFRSMLGSLPIRHEDFVLLDYGSGKGRAVLIAADLAWKRIVGIEYSRHYHGAMEQNIEKYRGPEQKCLEISGACVDATEFDPPEDPLVCYFYDPFSEPVMAGVADRLRASHDRKPRQIIVVYLDPKHGHVFEERGFSMRYMGPYLRQGRYAVYATESLDA